MSFTPIPFKTEHGLSQTNGVAKFSSAGIVLEFESKILGLISKGVKEVRLPIAELLDVKFRKGVLKRGAKIEIRLTSFAKLAELPNQEGKIVLKLGIDDWERARDAVSNIEKEIADYRASAPPAHTPVSAIFEQGED